MEKTEETAKTSKCQQRPHPSRWMVNGPSVPQSYAIPVERWALFGCSFFFPTKDVTCEEARGKGSSREGQELLLREATTVCKFMCINEAEKEPCANKQDHHNDHHYYHHLNLSLPKSTFWIFKTIRHSQQLSIFRCQESAPRTLFVTHLDTFTTEAQLQKSFATFGAVEQLGESRFVPFLETAETAVGVDTNMICWNLDDWMIEKGSSYG